jgi:hypothetical protein
LNGARQIARQLPAGDDDERSLRHDRILEEQVSLCGRQMEERAGSQVERVIDEDEERASQGHR